MVDLLVVDQACMLYPLKLNNYMNPSEFERTKPRKTYKSINQVIDKYKTYISEIEVIMTNEDSAFVDAYTEILEDLTQIKKQFLKGD